MAKPNLKIETWPIDKVLPYAKNARLHSDAQVTSIAASIREFGFINPCLVDDDGVLIAGHGRILGAKTLGMKTVPVIRLGHLTEDQARALRIADNAIPLGATWSQELIQSEIGSLKLAGYNIELLGFPEAQLRAFGVSMGNEGVTDPEIVPPLPTNPVSRTGDVWLLGDHRIICGDSTKAKDVAAVLDGAKPHLMVTDPPYGVDYDPDWRNRADRANGKPYGARAIGRVQNDGRCDWREAYALFPGDVAYCWHAGRHASSAQASLEASGFEIVCQIIWAKDRLIISRGDYHWQHDPCWYAVRKGKKHNWAGDRSQTTRWDISHPKSETGHGTQKPIACMRRPIENNSRKGDYVYDPFLGSGTTVIAAEMTGRKCLGLEIDPAYVDCSIERWQNHSGKAATLVSSGRTFAETKAARAKGRPEGKPASAATPARKTTQEKTDAPRAGRKPLRRKPQQPTPGDPAAVA